jgi:hypothetical protein
MKRIVTVEEIKEGDRVSFINGIVDSSISIIKKMILTSTRDHEWVNPWLAAEDPILCYKIIFKREENGYEWIHRLTLDFRLYKID